MSGRVSLEAAAAVINVLRVAIRAESAALGVRKSLRGRIGKTARESSKISLIGIREGSGILVWEPEHQTLFNAPGEAFDSIITELLRESTIDKPANLPMQKALLTLENVFSEQSAIESIEFADETGRSAKVDAETVYKIRLQVSENAKLAFKPSKAITGRLMEVDMASRTFRVDEITGRGTTISYDDLLEPIVVGGMNSFVAVQISTKVDAIPDLVSIQTIEDIPDSGFYEKATLAQIIEMQEIRPVTDIDALAMEDPEAVSTEEFRAFIIATRRGQDD